MNGVDYDSDKNADTVEDGLDYDRSPSAAPNPPWEAGPPDGAVTMADVLAVQPQVGRNCIGAPEEASVTYGYDDNGNQTGRGADTFAYDHENRLTQAVVGGVTSSSTYNGDGLRMSHTVGAGTTNYTWDTSAELPVVLQDGASTYVYGLDLISTRDGAGTQTYHLYDGLGSTVGLVDEEGNPVDGYTYDVFGAIRTQSDSSPNYWLFTGEQRDSESALYYLRARYYDPAVGRFATQDPVSAPMARPQALNRYAYVGGNPVNYGDPTGLWCPWNPEDCVDPAADFFTVTIPEAGRNAVSFLGNSYYDLNVTFGCGGWVFTGGLQFSFEQGLYGYAGGGRGSCGGSATVSIGPNQEISEGVTCSVQGQYTVGGIGPVPIAVGGQAGFSGVVIGFKESGPTFSGSPFGEVGLGVGMTGWAVTCYEVEKIIGF